MSPTHTVVNKESIGNSTFAHTKVWSRYCRGTRFYFRHQPTKVNAIRMKQTTAQNNNNLPTIKPVQPVYHLIFRDHELRLPMNDC